MKIIEMLFVLIGFGHKNQVVPTNGHTLLKEPKPTETVRVKIAPQLETVFYPATRVRRYGKASLLPNGRKIAFTSRAGNLRTAKIVRRSVDTVRVRRGGMEFLKILA